jgi:uncharacterized protein YbjT (DUF2867 family)
MGHRTHLILGATGLIGRELLPLLLADADTARVVVIARRPTDVRHEKLDEHVFDLAEMDRHAELFAVENIFCAFGTTIKQAGSQARFRAIDHDLPLQAARLGLANGAKHCLLVSSIGADTRSRLFYSRVKGEVEEDLRALGYPRLTIARPALLLGDRDEFRLRERLFAWFGWLMPPSYKPIEAHDVAQALLALSRAETPGVRVVESRELQQIASSASRGV